jgi:hypothetical protein
MAHSCPRCKGFIVIEHMPSESGYIQSRPCFKCVNCGYRNDLIYALNRRAQVGGQKEAYALPKT